VRQREEIGQGKQYFRNWVPREFAIVLMNERGRFVYQFPPFAIILSAVKFIDVSAERPPSLPGECLFLCGLIEHLELPTSRNESAAMPKQQA
jgi:hypothetical protein